MTTLPRFFRSVLITAIATGCGSVDSAGEGGLELATDSTLRVRQGSVAELAIAVTRTGELDSAVELSVSGLPAGVTAEPVVVEADQTEAIVRIVVDGTAPHAGPVSVLVEAIAIDDREATARAELAAFVAGGAGTFDTTFDGDGVLEHSFLLQSDVANDAMLDGAGRIVVSGRGYDGNTNAGWIARFTPAGTLDETFGTAGVIRPGADEWWEGRRLERDGDGFLVVLRTYNDQVGAFAWIRRYRDDSTIDTSYGDAGSAHASIVAPEWDFTRRGDGVVINDSVRALAFDKTGAPDESYVIEGPKVGMMAAAGQADGRVVYGTSPDEGSHVLVRMNVDGSVDTSFSDDGFASFALPQGHSQPAIHDVELDATGGGYAVGTSLYGNNLPHSVLMRFDANGGTTGMTTIEPTGGAFRMAMLPGGDVLVLGMRGPWEQATGLVKRYSPTGELVGEVALPTGVYFTELAYDAVAGRAVVTGYREDAGIVIARIWL